MVTTYRLRINELDQRFLDALKLIFGDLEVEITVGAADRKRRASSHRQAAKKQVSPAALDRLFKKVQALPAAQAITENDIMAEIRAHRGGK